MNIENTVVLVNNVALWSRATAVLNGNTLQILVANQSGGSDVVATFTSDFSRDVSGAVMIFRPGTSPITDSEGYEYDEIRLVPQGRGCGCNR